MTFRIFAGSLKGRLLRTPNTQTTRPTTGILRQAVFNMLQEEILNARFLDLFAGSGAMGFEALSRGAAFAVFVENGKQAARAIRENQEALRLENQSQLLAMDLFSALKSLAKESNPFHIAYIDPPYAEAAVLLPKILRELETLSLLAPQAKVFAESPAPLVYSSAYSSPKLQLDDERSFGIAHLSRFILR